MKNYYYKFNVKTDLGKAFLKLWHQCDKAEKAALADMDDNVFKPILNPLSDNDKIFLKALAHCGEPATTSELQSNLGRKGPAIQPYRKRLIEAGVIESPRRGELVFAVPYLSEYLQNMD